VAQQARTVRTRERPAQALCRCGRALMLAGPWLWRAGPVAGHGLRLRRLRLRGVSRATRSSIVFARPVPSLCSRSRASTPSRPQLLWCAVAAVRSAAYRGARRASAVGEPNGRATPPPRHEPAPSSTTAVSRPHPAPPPLARRRNREEFLARRGC
jgi:hypothetical protein